MNGYVIEMQENNWMTKGEKINEGYSFIYFISCKNRECT